MTARVTILVPTYEREQLLPLSLESALRQTYSDLVVRVYDNDSGYDAESLVRSFRDDRLSYVRREQNIGMFRNHVAAMQDVETEYFCILGDDNVAEPNYVEALVAMLDDDLTVGMAHSAFNLIDENGVEIQHCMTMAGDLEEFETGREFIERSLASRIRVCETATMFRTEVVREAGFYDEADEPLHDVGLFLRMAARASIAFCPEPLVGFRAHDTALGLQIVEPTYDELTTPSGFPARNLDVKMRFVRTSAPPGDAARWGTLARAARRRIMLEWVASLAGPARPRGGTLRLLREVARADRRCYVDLYAWGLLGLSLAGPRLAQAAIDLRRRVRSRSRL